MFRLVSDVVPVQQARAFEPGKASIPGSGTGTGTGAGAGVTASLLSSRRGRS